MAKRGIHFAMCDQSGFDYHGRARHQSLNSLVLDELAARHAFCNAFCQSPACGVRWMSFQSGKDCGP